MLLLLQRVWLVVLLSAAQLLPPFVVGQNQTESTTMGATIGPSFRDMNSMGSNLENPWQAAFSPNASRGLGGRNGTQLSLLVAIPLSYKGQPKLDPGFSHLVSALMAIDHFNERNPIIVKELNASAPATTNTGIIQDCKIQIDYDSLIIMDTGTVENKAMGIIMGNLPNHPNAIAGPYNEIPATEFSVIASSLRIPMVTHRGLDHNLLQPKKHPFLTQVNPDLVAEMQFLADYLRHVGRQDYVAILYNANEDSSLQRLEAFRSIAQGLYMNNVQSFGYMSLDLETSQNRSTVHDVRTIALAVEQIKESGYRTIVWLSPFFDADATKVGMAPQKHGLDQGDHLWVFGGGSEASTPSTLTSEVLSLDIMQFVRGAAYLTPYETFETQRVESDFMKAWKQLDASFVQRVRDINPFDQYQAGGWYDFLQADFDLTVLDNNFPPDDYFTNPAGITFPAFGSIYMYDAVMSIALGACNAVKSNITNSALVMSGEAHQAGIRSASFFGASGLVSFGGEGFPGSRTWNQTIFGVFNMLPEGIDGYASLLLECRISLSTDCPCDSNLT